MKLKIIRITLINVIKSPIFYGGDIKSAEIEIGNLKVEVMELRDEVIAVKKELAETNSLLVQLSLI